MSVGAVLTGLSNNLAKCRIVAAVFAQPCVRCQAYAGCRQPPAYGGADAARGTGDKDGSFLFSHDWKTLHRVAGANNFG